MTTSATDVRRQVLRRVRYALNAQALFNSSLPPEGPFDTALTNALLAIVHAEWTGQEYRTGSSSFLLPARGLIGVIDRNGGLAEVDSAVLRNALDLTQPMRHGSADDEFVTLRREHLAALACLDEHHALQILKKVEGKSFDEAIVLVYQERIEEEFPFDPKDRLELPDAEYCDDCMRETFMPRGWDMFGGTETEGQCIACGYERTVKEASEQVFDEALRRAVARATIDKGDSLAAVAWLSKRLARRALGVLRTTARPNSCVTKHLPTDSLVVHPGHRLLQRTSYEARRKSTAGHRTHPEVSPCALA